MNLVIFWGIWGNNSKKIPDLFNLLKSWLPILPNSLVTLQLLIFLQNPFWWQTLPNSQLKQKTHAHVWTKKTVYGGHFIVAGALLGIFAYICRQRPIILWWRWQSGTPAAWHHWCRHSQNSTGIHWISIECSSSERNGTPENFLSKEGIWYLKFFPLLANRQWKLLTVFGSTCCCWRGELPLHQATVNVKVSFGFSIRLVFINFFLHFSEYFLVI